MKKIKPYFHALPTIVFYQLVLSVILVVLTFLCQNASLLLINSTGRVAMSSGDIMFMVTTWQGWLIIIMFLMLLFVYVTLEIGSIILLTNGFLKGKKYPVKSMFKDSLTFLRNMLSPRGLAVVLFIAFALPIAGATTSISITSKFYIPHFIQSVIDSTPLFSIGYWILIGVIIVAFFFHLFALHGIVSGDVENKNALKYSRQLVKKNFLSALISVILFEVIYFAISFVIVFVTSYLPLLILSMLQNPDKKVTIFFSLLANIEILSVIGMTIPMFVMHLTTLFEKYRTGEEKEYPLMFKHTLPKIGIIALVVVAFCLVMTTVYGGHFEEYFKKSVTTDIIAHRAGGHEAPENTVAGLEKAISLGAKGGEIDIQRTKDGHYVVNHDATFERVAGDPRKSSEMTLEETKKLLVEGKAPVATFEEMLDASKDRIVLFVELKGETADKKMADDAVRTITERGMLDQAVIISLQYDLIQYIETTYQDVMTGYLCFATFGDTASLDCDFLGIEEQSATDETIKAIHDKGKKIMVWTPNAKEDQRPFLQSDADAIITDEVVQAKEVTKELENRTDFDVIIDKIDDTL